ncbi:carboxylesterase family protein [Adhaeretor mobilis]|uniref:Endo-1,4-beta-xylanase Z n=1 Tax=Adhaeretor mobilis TaxID=1930276 RepID=A0A517MXU5_9BACT|nr:dienelactone hydrolase family protein [Adhaeretor mobilis]QDS99647.1 Endo-1,4-beta-xylanase Z precursor [Adhaeretor mobilis]
MNNRRAADFRLLVRWSLAVAFSCSACPQTFAQYPEVKSQPVAAKKSPQQEVSTTLKFEFKQPFLLSLPEGYEESKQTYPLMLFLHGAGERGDGELERVKVHGPPMQIEQGKRFACIVVSPQCAADRWWDANELSALLDHIEANYRVDKKRIYLTGLSMGGYGSWALAQREPDRFAAIVPICGGGNARFVRYAKKISAPIWAFHGEKDSVVPVSELHEMQAALKEVGIDIRVTIYPEVGHDSWVKAYETPELYDWLFAQKRQ